MVLGLFTDDLHARTNLSHSSELASIKETYRSRVNAIALALNQ